MKNLLDQGYIKRNPDAAKHVMLMVIDRRQKHALNSNGRKPVKVVPKKVDLLKLPTRIESLKYVV